MFYNWTVLHCIQYALWLGVNDFFERSVTDRWSGPPVGGRFHCVLWRETPWGDKCV